MHIILISNLIVERKSWRDSWTPMLDFRGQQIAPIQFQKLHEIELFLLKILLVQWMVLVLEIL